jgi:hypothetical protein
MDRILQIERFDERRKVVGEGVVVVSVPRLTCAAMNAAAAGNSTISVGSQKVHLIFKGVRGEQPTLSAIRIFLLTSADRPGDPARSRELRISGDDVSWAALGCGFISAIRHIRSM